MSSAYPETNTRNRSNICTNNRSLELRDLSLFYDDINQALDETSAYRSILCGDFNAKRHIATGSDHRIVRATTEINHAKERYRMIHNKLTPAWNEPDNIGEYQKH